MDVIIETNLKSDSTDNNEESTNSTELAKVDELLKKAASSIDDGNYEDAISTFEQVVEMTEGIFGDHIELNEVKEKVKEIQDLLRVF